MLWITELQPPPLQYDIQTFVTLAKCPDGISSICVKNIVFLTVLKTFTFFQHSEMCFKSDYK